MDSRCCTLITPNYCICRCAMVRMRDMGRTP